MTENYILIGGAALLILGLLLVSRARKRRREKDVPPPPPLPRRFDYSIEPTPSFAPPPISRPHPQPRPLPRAGTVTPASPPPCPAALCWQELMHTPDRRGRGAGRTARCPATFPAAPMTSSAITSAKSRSFSGTVPASAACGGTLSRPTAVSSDKR